ncbi:hypothetical protein EIP91_001708 [Steccherinum ochraceum]|uniref:F-box domain-containing protein n=1 Tax=Steccherinum ochraceum TaxID=92696 RepID=A0A4R0RU54_9APHY|nr:hypothetical protein EIP91_001708 [Steccherinum ochraceum]
MATLSALPTELLLLILSDVAVDAGAGHITTTVGRVCKSLRHLVESSGLDVMYTSLLGTRAMKLFLEFLGHKKIAQTRVLSLLVVVDREHDNGSSGPTTCLELPVLPALIDLHLSGLIVTSPNRTPNLKRLQLLRILDLPPEDDDGLLPVLAPALTHFKLAFRVPSAAVLVKIFKTFRPYLDMTIARILHPNIALDIAAKHGFPISLRRVVLRFDIPADTSEDDDVDLAYRQEIKAALENVASLIDALVPDFQAIIPYFFLEIPLVVLPSANVGEYEGDGAGEDGRGYAEEFVKGWVAVNSGKDLTWT